MDAVLEGLQPVEAREAVFKAFIKALDESPEQYRKDAAAAAAAAAGAGGVEGLAALEAVTAAKAASAKGALVYSKFLAVGLFRLLELGGATEPAALARLAEAAGAPPAKVAADLTLYKGLLSKLAAAKELMAEILKREQVKATERAAEKAAKAAASASANA